MIIGLTQMLKDDFGIDFKNTALLDEAFTHASYVNEHPREKLKYYERIEFLGDAVMQLCVSEYLFKRYPTLPEGKLSRFRAAMVCEDSFSKFAKECHFDEYIRLGKGEEKPTRVIEHHYFVIFLKLLSGRYILTKVKQSLSVLSVGSSFLSLISAGLITT